jgi:hypothetical protein
VERVRVFVTGTEIFLTEILLRRELAKYWKRGTLFPLKSGFVFQNTWGMVCTFYGFFKKPSPGFAFIERQDPTEGWKTWGTSPVSVRFTRLIGSYDPSVDSTRAVATSSLAFVV